VDRHLPSSPSSFSLKGPLTKDIAAEHLPKDWPHAPVHRLSEHGVYFVTAGTYHKARLLNEPAKLDLVQDSLLKLSKQYAWQLEAWAVLSNHYHFVARGAPDSLPMQQLLRELHSRTARELNRTDDAKDRIVWHNFWDTRLTYQYAYLARLKYVHQNPVKHRLVPVASLYRWCSAAWFERVASPAQVKTIYGFKIDRLNVPDDF
jgi:putative transposase